MKKLIVGIVLILIFIVGCQSTSKNINTESDNAALSLEQYKEDSIDLNAQLGSPENNTPYSENILDYFPFEENIVKIYKQSNGNDVKAYIQYLLDNRIQFAIESEDSNSVIVYEKDDDEVRVVFKLEDSKVRENYLERTGFVGVYLRGPVEVGTTWVNMEGEQATISNVNVDIDGISSIEVTTENMISYFGYRVGLIRKVETKHAEKVVEEMAQFDRNQLTSFSFSVFKHVQDEWHEIPITYRIETNQNYKDLLVRELIKEDIVHEDTVIHSIVKEDSDNRVYVNISESIYKDIKTYEDEFFILQSLVRAIGDEYSVSEINLWVEGSAYDGPYIHMAKNELLKISK